MIRKHQKLRNIGLVILVLGLMALIVFLVGRAFGFFQYAKKGDVVNIITIKGIQVEVLNEEDDALNLAGAYPMYDEEGLENTPFEFNIINTSKKSFDISVLVENDETKQENCVVEGTNDPCTLLSTNYIRYSYAINDGEYSEPVNLGENSNLVFDTMTIAKNRTVKVSLKLWIDKDAPNSIQGNVFFGSLIIQGQKANLQPLNQLILANNTLRTEPVDTTVTEPLLVSYTDNEFNRNTHSTDMAKYQDRYITYSSSYTFNTSTGKYSLGNLQTCKYSECYETLKGKYVYNLYGTTSSSTFNYGSKDEIYKITSDTTLNKIYYIYSSKTENYDNSLSGLYKKSVTNGYGGADGDTYYFRGNVSNNKVSFAGKMWKIVRINEDGTVRLITNFTVDDSDFNSESDNYESVYYSNGSIKTAVEDWYSNNITGDDAKKVATGNYFCEAAKVRFSSYDDVGNATMATDDDYTPTLQCITDGNGKGLVNASVGLITEDELIYAGMTLRGSSPEFYFASQSWIMSPAGFDSVAKIWDSYCGSFDIKEADDYEWFHPVINLKSDTKALYDASTGTYIVE